MRKIIVTVLGCPIDIIEVEEQLKPAEVRKDLDDKGYPLATDVLTIEAYEFLYGKKFNEGKVRRAIQLANEIKY